MGVELVFQQQEGYKSSVGIFLFKVDVPDPVLKPWLPLETALRMPLMRVDVG